MSTYNARLRVPGRAKLPISVTVDIADEKLTLATEDTVIGVWALRDIAVDSRSDGFHLVVDGDEAVLSVADPSRFAGEIAAKSPRSAPSRGTGHSTTTSNPRASLGHDSVSGRIEQVRNEDQLLDIRHRIDDLGVALGDESIPPQVVFTRWLELLKEINRRHGQGTMPAAVFYHFNTELLDLIPVPTKPAPVNVLY